MTGILYLVCTVVFSLTIAQVLKFVETRSLRTLQILVVNYFVAFLVASLSTQWEETFTQPGILGVTALSIVVGALFIINFVVYSKSIDRNGMGISIAGMRMSLVIPICLSLFVYGEIISGAQLAGIGVSFLALFLLIPSISKERLKDWRVALLPVLLFLFTGLGESGLKIFEREYSSGFNQSHFLSGVFLMAFLIGVGLIVFRKQRNITAKEVLIGSLLGVVNLYSSHFLILALKTYPGAIVFPIVNLATIVAGTAIGLYYWKDTVSLRQWLGLVLALISIYLLL